jgi:nucleotide-binding universal stress UspA family protein
MAHVILCATDGTAHADKAVTYAAELSKALGGKLVLLAVRPYSLGRGGPTPLWDAQKIKDVLAAGQQQVRAAGVDSVEILEIDGPDVVDAILVAAREKHASQIVVGSGGKGTLQRSLIGSVSSGVVHKAHVPVTVVH